MKLYELINENSKSEALAFLLYYEKSASYIIEINSDIEEKDLPLILSSFFNKGIYTVDPNWSEKFVETRIIPRDRQNLSSVLQRYGLKEYDTGKLLDLSKGRCAQDDCAILPINTIPDWLKKRQEANIREAVFLHDMLMMLECEDDRFYFTDLRPLILNNQRLSFLKEQSYPFEKTEVMPGGYGIYLDDTISIMKDDLFKYRIEYQPDSADLKKFFETGILSTGEVCRKLNCSRQYVNILIKKNKLKIYKKFDNSNLFLRSDISKLLW